jgi:transcriptional regulator with XRE-family HTH domain
MMSYVNNGDSQSDIIVGVDARDVLTVARHRAGLTQRQLALRMGRPQATIGRWESGAREPAFADVMEALAACGFALGHRLFTDDGSLVGDASRRLALDPVQRVRSLHGSDELVASLLRVAASGLRCVVVGEVAGALQGWPLSLDANVLELAVDDRDHEAVVAGVRAAGGRPVATADRRPRWHVDTVQRLALAQGTAIEVMAHPAGVAGYRQLAARSDRLALSGSDQQVAGVHDLIAMAEASRDVGAGVFVTALYAVLDARRQPPPVQLDYDSPAGQAALEAWLSTTAA